MTNKNQVGETVWYYSHSLGKTVECEIKGFNPYQKRFRANCPDLQSQDFPLDQSKAYDTKAEAVEATRAWAENGIKNLQNILDNLKDDTDQMD